MSALWTTYVTAFVLGTAHAFEVDHMVAVTAFVGSQPRSMSAAAFGIRWGLGHATMLLVVGGGLGWSGLRLPPALSPWDEVAVGTALVGLGIWVTVGAGRLHFHDPADHGGHGHLHAHPRGATRHQHLHSQPTALRHRHASTLMGALHGLVGAAPAVALVPVAMIGNVAAALGYLVAFGAGTMVAMGTYSALAALAAAKTAASVRSATRLAWASGVASILVGMWWVTRAWVHGP